VRPSADPSMENPVIFGIVTGTPEQPQLTHLRETKHIPPELLALESPVKPTEIFRIAANCDQKSQHFDGGNCRLSQRIVEGLTRVSETLPAGTIRANYHWWHQEEKEACLRCLRIIRDNYIASEQLFQAADPSINLN
jgi:hypothetical protein